MSERPELQITIPLEGTGWLRWHCDTTEDYWRLAAWLRQAHVVDRLHWAVDQLDRYLDDVLEEAA